MRAVPVSLPHLELSFDNDREIAGDNCVIFCSLRFWAASGGADTRLDALSSGKATPAAAWPICVWHCLGSDMPWSNSPSFTQRFLQECAHRWELEQENVHGLRPGWPDLEFQLVTVSQEWLPLWHCHVDLAWAQHLWVLTHPLWHSTGCSRFHSHIKQGNCSSFWSQPVWGGVEYQLSKDWRALSRDCSQTHSSSWDVWTELGGKHQNCSVQISRAGTSTLL